jgi:predicted enzyme related to lactoylglutathione lyase
MTLKNGKQTSGIIGLAQAILNNRNIKKYLWLTVACATTFCMGYAYNGILTTKENTPIKVTGIGGIFFKCKNPKLITAWYQKHLGLSTNDYGATFNWYEGADSTKKAQTQWAPFAEKSKYFEPSKKDFMINYRVANLANLVKDLKQEGVTILDTMETYDYGKFIHILDAEGNKLQLWEPID